MRTGDNGVTERRGPMPADDELDRVVASLTDASPSADLRTTVMRRIAEVSATNARTLPSSTDKRWDWRSAGLHCLELRARLAIAAALVAIAAVSTWLLVRPAASVPAGRGGSAVAAVPNAPRANQTGTPSQPTADLPALGEETTRIADARPHTRIAKAQRRGRNAPEVPVGSPSAGEPAEVVDDTAAAIAPIEMPPIQHRPLSMAPVDMQPIEIPEIEIGPMNETVGGTNQPMKGDPAARFRDPESRSPTQIRSASR